MVEVFDKLIIGAGMYGLYSALRCGRHGQKVLVLECDQGPFCRATYINQARVHMGYHYPRSFSTAIKSAHYFERFCKEYGFCNMTEFDQIYATGSHFSWTNASEFQKFCSSALIRCDPISPEQFFNRGKCDGAFITKEYTYDAQVLKKWFLEQLDQYNNVQIIYNHRVSSISQEGSRWVVTAGDIKVETPFILNASYAGINEIHRLAHFEPFKIKYELCEIILCRVNDQLKKVGLTVMDGPFFSIMPFGKTGYHSLTSVTFTPHDTSFSETPVFPCQQRSDGKCNSDHLFNCNECSVHPESAWPYMSQLARTFLRPEFQFSYVKSLFSMKPILLASEIDDSRPTVIRQFADNPTFISVLSGKINTVFDLDEVLDI